MHGPRCASDPRPKTLAPSAASKKTSSASATIRSVSASTCSITAPEHRAQWGQGRQFGVMIDEVERVMPEAVSMHPDGYKRVDHSLLGIHQHTH